MFLRAKMKLRVSLSILFICSGETIPLHEVSIVSLLLGVKTFHVKDCLLGTGSNEQLENIYSA